MLGLHRGLVFDGGHRLLRLLVLRLLVLAAVVSSAAPGSMPPPASGATLAGERPTISDDGCIVCTCTCWPTLRRSRLLTRRPCRTRDTPMPYAATAATGTASRRGSYTSDAICGGCNVPTPTPTSYMTNAARRHDLLVAVFLHEPHLALPETQSAPCARPRPCTARGRPSPRSRCTARAGCRGGAWSTRTSPNSP